MSANTAFGISVFPGDGIGHEVIEPTVALLDAVKAGSAGSIFATPGKRRGPPITGKPAPRCPTTP